MIAWFSEFIIRGSLMLHCLSPDVPTVHVMSSVCLISDFMICHGLAHHVLIIDLMTVHCLTSDAMISDLLISDRCLLTRKDQHASARAVLS